MVLTNQLANLEILSHAQSTYLRSTYSVRSHFAEPSYLVPADSSRISGQDLCSIVRALTAASTSDTNECKTRQANG